MIRWVAWISSSWDSYVEHVLPSKLPCCQSAFRLLSQAYLHSKDKCTNPSLIFSEDLCTMWHSIINDYYVVVYYSSIVLNTIINLLTCPFVIFMNACFITAVRTKRRLQTMHNILLACLAVTDLLVGFPAIRTRHLNLN